MNRDHRILLVAALSAVVMWDVACSDVFDSPDDRTNPLGELDPDPDYVVTEPVAVNASPAAAAGATNGVVAYVSLPPGTLPDGQLVVITNLASGDSVTALMLGGGFDPTSIAAAAGDTLVIDAFGPGNTTLGSTAISVPRRRPPVVVRTDPPKRRIDVPLNIIVRFVFSEPVDPLTVNGTTVALYRGATRIEGTVTLKAPENLRAELQPGLPLEPDTEYRLVATGGVRDLAGDALEAYEATFTTLPVADFAFVSVGHLHTCGITPVGVPLCWGGNRLGQLGIGRVDEDAHPVPVPVAGVRTLRQISASDKATYGVAPDGRGYRWGTGPWGTFGRDRLVTLPESIPAFEWHMITAGMRLAGDVLEGATCGLVVDGTVGCWGDVYIGDNTWSLKSSPHFITGPLFEHIEAGQSHVCGQNGMQLYCWGPNDLGQLGDGTTSSGGTTPTLVAGGMAFPSMSVGSHHTCGIRTDGTLSCWGSARWGQLGIGRADESVHPVPEPVAGLPVMASVSAGVLHTCALDTRGQAYCWGHNAQGQLGIGNTTPSYIPAPVTGGLRFRQINAGDDHTCGVAMDGHAYCWGSNYRGQLGDGTTTASPVPVRVQLP